MRKSICFALALAMALAGCASPTPAPEPTVTVAPTATQTAAPTSTELPELTPTAPVGSEQGGEAGFDWESVPVGEEIRLDDAMKQELGLTGGGFLETVDYEGVKVSFVILMHDNILEKGAAPPTFMPNPPEGFDPAKRMAEAILRGHWRGWQEDHGKITFDEFVERLRKGEDMRYSITGVRVGESRLGGTITIDPSAPTELLDQRGDHSENGDTWLNDTPKFAYGYYQREDGGLRLVLKTPPSNNGREFYDYFIFLGQISSGLWALGYNEEHQAGGFDLQRLPGDKSDEPGYTEYWDLMSAVSTRSSDWWWDDMILQPLK